MIKLHLNSKMTIEQKGATLDDIKNALSSEPVFLELPGMLVRTEDISVIEEVHNDEN